MVTCSQACVISRMPYLAIFSEFCNLDDVWMSAQRSVMMPDKYNGKAEQLTAACGSRAFISLFGILQWLNPIGTWLCLGHLLWHLIHPQLPVAFFGACSEFRFLVKNRYPQCKYLITKEGNFKRWVVCVLMIELSWAVSVSGFLSLSGGKLLLWKTTH